MRKLLMLLLAVCILPTTIFAMDEAPTTQQATDNPAEIDHNNEPSNAAARFLSTRREWDENGAFARKTAELKQKEPAAQPAKHSSVLPHAPQLSSPRFPALDVDLGSNLITWKEMSKFICHFVVPGYFLSLRCDEKKCTNLRDPLNDAGLILKYCINLANIIKGSLIGLCAWPLMYRFMPARMQLGGWAHVIAPLGAGLIGMLGYFGSKYHANHKYKNVLEQFKRSVADIATPQELDRAYNTAEKLRNKTMQGLVQAIQWLQQSQK